MNSSDAHPPAAAPTSATTQPGSVDGVRFDEIVVCWKHAAIEIEVDPLTGASQVDPRRRGVSPADRAALEVALGLGRRVTVITAGDEGAKAILDEALAVGSTRAIWCPGASDASSRTVATALADNMGDPDLVICGDHSADRGSGTVPAFIAARRRWPQALGLVAVTSEESSGGPSLTVERRLDRGCRERLRVNGPAVISVEGSLARLRRAGLGAMLADTSDRLLVGQPLADPTPALAGSTMVAPFKARTRPRPAPTGSEPLARVMSVTKAAEERTPPRLLELDPSDAAAAIIEQLTSWGHLDA